MRFNSPSELLKPDSEARKAQESIERNEHDLEREKVTLALIEDLRSHDASGVGTKGDFYSRGDSNVGVKHLARPERAMPYENTLREEARLQTLALLTLERARLAQQARIDSEPDPSKKAWLAQRMPSKVPFVVGYARDEAAAERGEASEYIVMETVPGKTLSHLMFQKMAEKLRENDPAKYAVFADASAWREDVLIDAFIAHVDELKGYTKEDAAQVIYNTLHGSGIFSEDVALQVGAAVRALNNAGFFHRDLHERNIMISEDGTQSFIIDFGTAKYDPAYGEDSRLDRQGAYDVGAGQKLWDDQNIAFSIPDLTSNPKKPLKPNARRIKLRT